MVATKRLRFVIVSATLLAVAFAAGPAPAHSKTYTGSILGRAGEPRQAIDLYVYHLRECEDILEGLQASVINAVPLRNHLVTVSITTRVIGGSRLTLGLLVRVGTNPCTLIDSIGAQHGHIGAAHGREPLSFRVAPNATHIVLVNTSQFPVQTPAPPNIDGQVTVDWRLDAGH